MQSFNGRQAVMSALEALVLAGKGLNAFSVLFKLHMVAKMKGQRKNDSAWRPFHQSNFCFPLRLKKTALMVTLDTYDFN
jgi:hypothetical protein